MYSAEEKNMILLRSDLVGRPLSSGEYQAFAKACKRTAGDFNAALSAMPRETAEKIRRLSERGMKLAVELGKLEQRGVSVLFDGERLFECIKNRFVGNPSLLFAIGDSQILLSSSAPVFTSLSHVALGSFRGILIADRPFDHLLRDADAMRGVKKGDLITVSDRYRTRASVREAQAGSENARVARVFGAGSDKAVFISGSRSQRKIPQEVQDSINTILNKGFTVLIGDSDTGVDNEIIDYLRAPLYPNVVVYTICNTPRVEPEPEWQVETLEADHSLKPQKRQMVKDRAMAAAADWGLAVFRPIEKNRYGSLQVSSGTLRNAIQMLLSGKKVKLFYWYEGSMRSSDLKSLVDLEGVIGSYQMEHLSDAERRDVLTARGVQPDADPAAVRCEKLFKKYRQLLADEQKAMADGGQGSMTPEPFRDDGQRALPLFA